MLIFALTLRYFFLTDFFYFKTKTLMSVAFIRSFSFSDPNILICVSPSLFVSFVFFVKLFPFLGEYSASFFAFFYLTQTPALTLSLFFAKEKKIRKIMRYIQKAFISVKNAFFPSAPKVICIQLLL